MVVKSDISAWLVPVGSNLPFKEHIHEDGSVYVEVKPNVEFRIGVKRISISTGKPLRIDIHVDGQDIGYSSTFHP
jgi:hypothetical protein